MWELAMFMILGIKEGLSIQPSSVNFDKTPVNVTVIAGNTAVLPCIVENRGEQQIIWMTPQKILISMEDRRVIDDMRMSIERPFVRDWNLHIRAVETKDNGIYTCQVNTNPIQIKRIHLNVLVPATIIDESPNHVMTVREWETVQLSCNATGVPEPSVTWYRHTRPMEKEKVGAVGEILLIHNITRHCSGVYGCVANNSLAEPDVKEIRVDVEFAPEVVLPTTRMGHYLGRETMLECRVNAFPVANFLWKKGDTQFSIKSSSSTKYRVELVKGKDYTSFLYLSINNLAVEDFGMYTCEASNRLGRDSRDMLLYEYHHPTTRRPSTKAPMPDGIETVKLTSRPTANVKDEELLYIYRSDHLNATNNHINGYYKKPQGIFNTGYVGAGDRYVNSSSISMMNPLWPVTNTIIWFLLILSEFFLGR